MGDEEKTGRAKGGIARAEKLSSEERKAISRKAALSRWEGKVVIATHEGEFSMGSSTIACANLPNKQRIITQATFLRALGRSRSPKAGTGVLSTVDDLPFFLQAEVLKPFIDEDLYVSTKPIFYRTKDGKRGVGYDATLLPKVAEVYLRYRDHCMALGKDIPKQYQHIIIAADILMRGLAQIGIIALVDAATGYEKDRAKEELAKILELFVAKELQPYIKTFSAEYYEQIFRLRGLPYPNGSVKRPQYFGHITNDIIYRRLAPGVWKDLKEKAIKNESGRPKHKLFQRLTPDLGHPKLRDLLISIITIMKLSNKWWDFKNKLDRLHPAYNETMQLPLELENDTGEGF